MTKKKASAKLHQMLDRVVAVAPTEAELAEARADKNYADISDDGLIRLWDRQARRQGAVLRALWERLREEGGWDIEDEVSGSWVGDAIWGEEWEKTIDRRRLRALRRKIEDARATIEDAEREIASMGGPVEQ